MRSRGFDSGVQVRGLRGFGVEGASEDLAREFSVRVWHTEDCQQTTFIDTWDPFPRFRPGIPDALATLSWELGKSLLGQHQCYRF